MAEMHRLSANQLHVNEALPWDVMDASGQLLLRKGYVIQKDEQIERILERGMYVDAEVYKAYIGADAGPAKHAYDPIAVWHAVQAANWTLMVTPPTDGSFANAVQGNVKLVMGLCERHPDLVLAAIQLKEYKRYPAAHSLHVAALCEMIARRGDFDEESRMSLCCAALTQNIAMADAQQLLFHQKIPLNEDQRKLIHDHPMNGARLLQSLGVEDKEWLRAVLEHHEDEAGSGYPRKVRNPSMLASLIHTADSYAAMLSKRAFRKAMTAAEAAKQLYLALGQGKECPFPGLLIKELGMFPPGSIVKLANGEVGVVWRRGAQSATPLVAALINAKGLAQMNPVKRDTAAAPEFKVVATLPRESTMLNINFDQLWRPRN
ncbi:MAG: HD domain-containing phosphohydrolase [Rhodocyclaceae bacterium]